MRKGPEALLSRGSISRFFVGVVASEKVVSDGYSAGGIFWG